MPPTPVGVTVYGLCEDTLGVTRHRRVAIDTTTKLGCGCTRYAGDRPGPRSDGGLDRVHFLSGCCVHACQIAVKAAP